MRGGGWGPALRIAWRTARHHRGRTALVAVLVALPVLVGGFLDVVARTAQLPADEKVRRFMGTADAYVEFAGTCGPITGIVYYDHYPSSVEGGVCVEGPAEQPVAAPDLQALLPQGSVVASRYPIAALYQRRVTHGDRSARLEPSESDISSPLLDGIYRLVGGRLPATRSEVLASQEALERLNATVGDEVTVSDGPSVTIVGRYVDPTWLGSTTIIGLSGWLGAAIDRSESGQNAGGGALLVDLPDGVDPVALQSQLLTEGVILAPRAHVLDPPEQQVALSAGGVDFQAVSLVMLVVGFGLLEVVLLAGTAFAVSARRQVRDLGLVAAAGGEARHVRRIVLAQGVVIGFVGAAVAIPLAITAVFFGRPWLEPANGALMGPLDVRPAELSALVLIGLLSGLAAALVPAFTAARLSVLDALSKRFKSTSLRTSRPRFALAVLVTGVAVTVVGAGLWRNAQLAFNSELERYQEALRAAAAAATPNGEQPIVRLAPPEPPGDALYLALMLFGFSLVAVALAISAPALVATIARLGRRMPLSARLALRDAGRHRHRTGPAVAAIMAAVAGSVGLAFYTLSDNMKQEKEYSWSLRLGQASVQFAYDPSVDPSYDEDRFLQAVDRASEALPATALLPVRVAEGGPDPEHWSSAGAQELPTSDCGPAAVGELGPFGDYFGNPQLGVDDGSILALTGDSPDAARSALRDGKVVVTDCHYINDGEATIAVKDKSGVRTTALPAVYIPREPLGDLPIVLVGDETAESLDLPVRLSAVVIDTDQVPTRDEEDVAQEILDREVEDGGAYLSVERGHQSQNSVVFLALVGGSAFVTLVGTAIAVALAASESRADHATLLAVGAEPRRRRVLAMGQAATVSVLGVGLGVVLGAIVGASILGGHEALPFVVPWLPLAQIAVGIPLVGVLIAGLFTRSRLPLDRRLG